MKFGTEIDLEIIRIVKHIKKTASFFKFRNTVTNKKNYSGSIPILSGTVMKINTILYMVLIMKSMLFRTKS